MHHASRPARRVLISGASIAGPALAYWLTRYGFEVTVVEKAAAVRGGGYAIDIRGTAREVVARMGLLPRLREVHVGTQRITFVDAAGETVASLMPEQVTGGEAGLDLEIRRGDLAEALYAPLRDQAEFLFNDSIATLDDDGDGVHVVFDSGTRRTFDLVVGRGRTALEHAPAGLRPRGALPSLPRACLRGLHAAQRLRTRAHGRHLERAGTQRGPLRPRAFRAPARLPRLHPRDPALRGVPRREGPVRPGRLALPGAGLARAAPGGGDAGGR